MILEVNAPTLDIKYLIGTVTDMIDQVNTKPTRNRPGTPIPNRVSIQGSGCSGRLELSTDSTGDNLHLIDMTRSRYSRSTYRLPLSDGDAAELYQKVLPKAFKTVLSDEASLWKNRPKNSSVG